MKTNRTKRAVKAMRVSIALLCVAPFVLTAWSIIDHRWTVGPIRQTTALTTINHTRVDLVIDNQQPVALPGVHQFQGPWDIWLVAFGQQDDGFLRADRFQIRQLPWWLAQVMSASTDFFHGSLTPPPTTALCIGIVTIFGGIFVNRFISALVLGGLTFVATWHSLVMASIPGGIQLSLNSDAEVVLASIAGAVAIVRQNGVAGWVVRRAVSASSVVFVFNMLSAAVGWNHSAILTAALIMAIVSPAMGNAAVGSLLVSFGTHLQGAPTLAAALLIVASTHLLTRGKWWDEMMSIWPAPRPIVVAPSASRAALEES